MKRLAAVAQLAVCFVLLFCISGNSQTRPSELVGYWVDGTGIGNSQELDLLKDGRTNLGEGITISWKVENKRLVLFSLDKELVLNYKISGYQLILIQDDGNVDTLVRKENYAKFKAKRDAAIEAEDVKQVAGIAEAKLALEKLPKFTDSRDNKIYSKVTIGGKTWMAENLNYAAEDSKCYENKDANCAKYGRLYNWRTANKACPAGYHLPSDKEWDALVVYAGGAEKAGTKLKSSTGWHRFRNDASGTNAYGFSALPGGSCGGGVLSRTPETTSQINDNFSNAGYFGFWWSATEGTADDPKWLMMRSGFEDVEWLDGNILIWFSIRCVED